MVDSVYVLPPLERATDDATGAPVSGGTLEFYDAGTTTPKTVYADADLTVPLGTSVVTDSLGYPLTGGGARTLIYVGSARYKVVIKDADDVEIVTHDNIPGAVVSASSVDVAVTAVFPVVTKSLDYAVLQADQNTTFVVNCSSADVTLTLPSAVTVGAGWKIKVQHAGSANQALLVVAAASGQVISEGSKSFGGGYALALNGEDIEISSDSGNWRVSSHTTSFPKVAQGIIPITDRLATSPGSPVQGSLYLLTGTGGSWSGFASNDIAQYTGVGWVNFTPYTDCGWRVYVADENLDYRFMDSAWVIETATASVPGTIKVSTQALMEAGAATDAAVLPAHVKYNPGVAKAGARFGNAADIVSGSSFGVTSVTDNGTGDATVNLSITLSASGTAIPLADTFDTSGSDLGPCRITSISATAIRVENMIASNGSHRDPSTGYSFILFGDL